MIVLVHISLIKCQFIPQDSDDISTTDQPISFHTSRQIEVEDHVLFECDEPISASMPAQSGKKKNDGQVCIYYRYLFDYCVGKLYISQHM